MREAIKERISRRSFTGEAFDERERDTIVELIKRVNDKSNLSIEYIEDASNAFNSFKKSYGMFNNVKTVLLMKGKQDDENLTEKVGYYGEEIILYLTDMSIGSCWVGGTFDKSKFECPNDEKIVCVIVIGKPTELTLKEKMIRSAISKKRKPVNERIISKVEVPSWLIEAVEAVRLAPSAVNSQKPTLYYDGQNITISVNTSYPMDMIDLGIAKKHFEETVNGKFDLGNQAQFVKY